MGTGETVKHGLATKVLKDKREGSCASGPCRMPRRCWRYENCYLYAATGGEAS